MEKNDMKKMLSLILIGVLMLTLVSCEEADAIKNVIKDKLPKQEEYEVIESVANKPTITEEFEHPYSLLVIQEVNKDNIITVIDETAIRYSIPNWFGDTTLEPGTYMLVEHADNSLPTSPMQFGYIYSMQYFAKDGSVIKGVK